MTSQEWLLRLVFRVGKNAFPGYHDRAAAGHSALGLIPGLEITATTNRVWVTNHKKGPWQSVTLLVYKLAEIDTPAFRGFLKDAVASFHANVKRLKASPRTRCRGRSTASAGTSATKALRRAETAPGLALLPRLLALVREVEPRLEITWDSRDAITLRVPGITRGWAPVAHQGQ